MGAVGSRGGSHLLISRLTAVAACSAVLVNGRGTEGGRGRGGL